MATEKKNQQKPAGHIQAVKRIKNRDAEELKKLRARVEQLEAAAADDNPPTKQSRPWWQRNWKLLGALMLSAACLTALAAGMLGISHLEVPADHEVVAPAPAVVPTPAPEVGEPPPPVRTHVAAVAGCDAGTYYNGICTDHLQREEFFVLAKEQKVLHMRDGLGEYVALSANIPYEQVRLVPYLAGWFNQVLGDETFLSGEKIYLRNVGEVNLRGVVEDVGNSLNIIVNEIEGVQSGSRPSSMTENRIRFSVEGVPMTDGRLINAAMFLHCEYGAAECTEKVNPAMLMFDNPGTNGWSIYEPVVKSLGATYTEIFLPEDFIGRDRCSIEKRGVFKKLFNETSPPRHGSLQGYVRSLSERARANASSTCGEFAGREDSIGEDPLAQILKDPL